MTLTEYLQQPGNTQKAMADAVGVSQGRISQWVGGERIPAEHAKAIEVFTKGAVKRHELRPDIFDAPRKRA